MVLLADGGELKRKRVSKSKVVPGHPKTFPPRLIHHRSVYLRVDTQIKGEGAARGRQGVEEAAHFITQNR